MTPTEQDNLSIEEKVSVVLDVLIGHHLCPADENDQSCLLNISTKEISQLITANYTPINQPSTKITPVTDGVGGSESTNQSEHKEVK